MSGLFHLTERVATSPMMRVSCSSLMLPGRGMVSRPGAADGGVAQQRIKRKEAGVPAFARARVFEDRQHHAGDSPLCAGQFLLWPKVIMATAERVPLVPRAGGKALRWRRRWRRLGREREKNRGRDRSSRVAVDTQGNIFNIESLLEVRSIKRRLALARPCAMESGGDLFADSRPMANWCPSPVR